MDDLISRKQAIDACMKYNGYGSVWACIMGDIKQLPSVTIKDTADKIKVTNCNDLISRQAAINAHCMCSCGKERDEYCKCDDIPLWFDVLPSAQPEILACGSGELVAQSEPKEIRYTECANAMLKMWIDNVLTDGEYNRIMDKLNKYWLTRKENR